MNVALTILNRKVDPLLVSGKCRTVGWTGWIRETDEQTRFATREWYGPDERATLRVKRFHEGVAAISAELCADREGTLG